VVTGSYLELGRPWSPLPFPTLGDLVARARASSPENEC